MAEHGADQSVAEAANLELPAARGGVDALIESVASALARGDRVVVLRFEAFYAAPRKTGVARNPRTGDPVGIPRGRVARFRPATDLRNLPGSR